MDDTQLNDLESADPVQVSKYRWLPMMEVEPGMVIARPVLGMAGVLETMYVAIGATITASTIAQMMTKGVEYVAVLDPLPTEFSDDGRSIAEFETRLKVIFGKDPNSACRALMDALILARPTLC